MSSRLLSDFATPYDIMVGFWAKQSIMYDRKGNYLDIVPGRVAVYWKTRGKLMHFREDLLEETPNSKKRTAPIYKLIRSEFDLKVEGRYAFSVGSRTLKVISGTEARPDIYHFHLKTNDGYHWYNNHYFINSNERHIMGPSVRSRGNGEIDTIVAQTLTRISYTIPAKLRRKLRE